MGMRLIVAVACEDGDEHDTFHMGVGKFAIRLAHTGTRLCTGPK